jgi:protein involved in polysaccharide export with SLBB domain
MRSTFTRLLFAFALALVAVSALAAWQAPAKDAEVYWVTGAVKKPGQRIWTDNMTVGAAIDGAEGMTEHADFGRSYIQRRNAEGKIEQIGNLALTTPVLARDVVNIRPKLF